MFKTPLMNLAKFCPFLLSAVTPRYRSMSIAVTMRCNCRCIMCNYWRLPAENELTADEIGNIVSQAKDLGVEHCQFYGGEPLLNPGLPDFVARARSAGMRTKIITNGSLLTGDMIARLSSAGLDEIAISLDACDDEKLRTIRGRDGIFSAVSRALDDLAPCRGKIEVKLAPLLMLPTLENRELLAVVSFAEKRRIPVIIQLIDFSLFYFKDTPPELRTRLWIDESHIPELRRMVDELTAIKKRSPGLIDNSLPSLEQIPGYFMNPRATGLPCYNAYAGRIWIGAQGNVYSCQGLPPLGNIRAARLADIVGSEPWKRRLPEMFKKHCPGCSCNFASNIDAHIPYVWKDRLKRMFRHG